MNPFRCTCPHCQAAVHYKFLGPGEEGMCPQCRQVFTLPDGGEWTGEEPPEYSGMGVVQGPVGDDEILAHWLPRTWGRLAPHFGLEAIWPILALQAVLMGMTATRGGTLGGGWPPNQEVSSMDPFVPSFG